MMFIPLSHNPKAKKHNNIKMKKILTFLLILFSVTTAVYAAKAKRGWVQVKQSDGSYLWIQGYGDEHLHWYTTKDSVLLCHIGMDYYVAKTEAQGILTSTGVLAHEPEGRSAREMALIACQNRELFFSAFVSNITRSKMSDLIGTNSGYFPHVGSPKVLVILADFNDQRFLYNDQDTKEIFNAYLNADGRPKANCDNKTNKKYGVSANYGSVKQYFKDMSYGAYTPQFDVYGPVHLSQNMAYYGNNGYNRMDYFIPDVCNKAYKELGVDFSKYDSDGDKKVDLVYVIFAGYSGSIYGTSNDCIWPKTGTQYAGPYNGVTVNRYSVANELNGNPEATSKNGFMINGIGLFCHEFSHAMGLPDLYSTSKTAQADNQGMEDWSLLDGGEYVYLGYYPTAYTAWEREAMGWMEIETLTEKGTYLINSLTQGIDGSSNQYIKGNAYRIYNDQDPNRNEYYILENIQREGWNYALGTSFRRPHGMMITHVDFDRSRFSLSWNSVNGIKGHPRMTVLPADGRMMSSYSDKNHYADNMECQLYPGKCNVDFFDYDLPARTLTTTAGKDTIVSAYPNPIVYNGSVEVMASTKPIKNIREDTKNRVIYFDFIEPGITAGIDSSLVVEHKDKDLRIFSLDGRYLGTDLDRLPKGIYIRNGRKISK